MNYRTSIQLHRATLDRLQRVGRFGESYDDLLNRILDESSEQHFSKRSKSHSGCP